MSALPLFVRPTAAPVSDAETGAEIHALHFATVEFFDPALAELMRAEEREHAKGLRRKPEYMPTPEQIAADCAEIRKGWSRAEHLERAGIIARMTDAGRYHWTPPTIRTNGVGSEVRR